jgi:methionyl-tRNA synthetase
MHKLVKLSERIVDNYVRTQRNKDMFKSNIKTLIISRTLFSIHLSNNLTDFIYVWFEQRIIYLFIVVYVFKFLIFVFSLDILIMATSIAEILQ